MSKLTYTTKAKIISIATPVVLIALFAFGGYHSLNRLFADTPSPEGVSLTSSLSVYKASSPIELILDNNTPNNIYVTNNCPSNPLSVYYKQGDELLPISATTNKSRCLGEPQNYLIAPYKSVGIWYTYWPDLFNRPGKYVVKASIEGYGNGPTANFEIE